MFITIPVNAMTEGGDTSFSTETKKMLKNNIQPRSFPVIGDRLDDEMIKLAKTVSTASHLNGANSEENWTRFMNDLRDTQLPWTIKASAIVNLNDDMKILDPEYVTANKTIFTNSLGSTQT